MILRPDGSIRAGRKRAIATQPNEPDEKMILLNGAATLKIDAGRNFNRIWSKGIGLINRKPEHSFSCFLYPSPPLCLAEVNCVL